MDFAQAANNDAPDPEAFSGKLTTDQLKAANINPDSHLATDYLNHFNEMIMLMELVPSMPECLEDAQAWQPKSYEQHFRDSGLAHADLIIAAYHQAPPSFRDPFDAAVKKLNEDIASGLSILEMKLSANKMEALDAWTDTILAKLNRSIESISATINGYISGNDQGRVDSIIEA